MTTKAPIFDYADRYFLDCQYTKEELFELQEKILNIVKGDSLDILLEIKKQTKINDREIDICLRKCYTKGLIQHERIRIDGDVPIYRYYT